MEHASNYRSPEIHLIIGALAKAQGTYKPLIANEDAPGGKFANLQAILDAVRESLSTNGLAFYQYIELLDEGSGAALLRTVLGHESGQFISSCARVVSGKTDRQTGNTYEFHKRMHALLILGLAPSPHDPLLFDDNGTEMAHQFTLEQMKKPKSERVIDRQDTIDTAQYERLLEELDGYDEMAKDILETYNIETFADLPKSEYQKMLIQIRKLQKTHEEYINRRK